MQLCLCYCLCHCSTRCADQGVCSWGSEAELSQDSRTRAL